jgi:phosphoenolpyruvate carboxykinase (ATP)
MPERPEEILIPRNVWSDKSAYEATAKKLANLFASNFVTYGGGVSDEVKPPAQIRRFKYLMKIIAYRWS